MAVVDVFTWLLGVQAIGLVAMPFAFILFHKLPDRGYAFTIPLGMVGLSYGLWILAHSRFVPNSQWTVIGLLITMALVGSVLLWSKAREFGSFVREQFPVLIVSQGLFLSVFLIWVLIRSHDPFVDTAEKPADFAFLNALVLNRQFPPMDPWLSGYSIAYYYFGHLMMSMLTNLTGVSTAISYNLAVALIPALAACGAFGLGYNLVRLASGSSRAAMGTGLVAALFLVAISNLAGVLELFNGSGIGSSGFWEWVGIKGMDGQASTGYWHPTDHYWWWRTAHVIDTVVDGASLDYTINEFPFYSFLLGDLHPHMMNIPFILLTIALCLNLLASPERLSWRWLRTHPFRIAAFSLCLGAVGFVNTWDLPSFVMLFGGILFLKAYGDTSGTFWRTIPSIVPVAFAVVLGMGLLYYLFFANLGSTQVSGILPVQDVASQPLHLFLIWGLFAFITLSFLLRQIFDLPGDKRWQPIKAIWATFWTITPILLWGLMLIALLFMDGRLGDAAGIVTSRAISILPMAGGIAISLYSLLIRQAEKDSPGVIATLALIALGYFMVMAVELFYIVDVFFNRMNTVFKVHYQAWIVLAIASAFCLFYLNRHQALTTGLSRLGGYLWGMCLVLLLLASLYYPPAAVDEKTSSLSGVPSLDALGFLALEDSAEYRAVNWLRDRAKPDAVILEAVGPQYSMYGIVSASTGIPTVLGWAGHELQWRGSSRYFHQRPQDVKELYQTEDEANAIRLLYKYQVNYVYVGPRERTEYGTQGLAKFDTIMELIFQDRDVSIYHQPDLQRE